MTELTHIEICDALAPLFLPSLGVSDIVSRIATQVQTWQVEQRIVYRQQISRLEHDLAQERRARVDAELRISVASAAVQELLERYWQAT
jgi:hypothetical protein